MNALKLSHFAGSCVAFATAATTLLGAAPVLAQDRPAASGGLEEIVVTATRREQALQDVALSVTALSADSLASRNVYSISDLNAGTVPGLVPTMFSGSPQVLAIAVRGVGLSDPTQGTTELTVPVYIDGVFLGRGQGLGLELIEPERIEILRGPQGQLFGRNAEGGVVQYVSRKPSGEFGLRGSASFGNFNAQRYKLSLDLPEVGGFSAQLSGLLTKWDPYTPQASNTSYPAGRTPPGPNEGYNAMDSKGFRVAVRWQNDAGFIADYSYDDSNSDATEAYLTWMDVDLVASPTSNALPTEDLPERTTERLYNEGFELEGGGHNLTLAWPVSDAVTLKSITSYRETSREGASTLGNALPAGVSSRGFIYTASRETMRQHQASEELQFIGTWDRFDLTAGAMYYTESVRDRRQSLLTGPGLIGPVTFIQPAGLAFCVNAALDPCQTGDNRQQSETKSFGVYAQGNYRPASFDDKLELTLGLRYTDDKKDALRTFSNVAVNLPSKFKESRVDPALVVKYEWTPSVQTFLRYATAYRAGGANVRSSNFAPFQEEENESIELGLKSRVLDNRLQANVSVFQSTIKGEQLTIQEQPTTNPSLTNTFNNPVDKKVKGVELELYWAATDNLGLGFNFAYMDAPDYVEYDNPFTTTVRDLARFYTVSTPETSGSFNVDYKKAGLPWNSSLSFNASYTFASGHYWLTPGAQLVSSFLPTYKRPEADMSMLGARLSWDFELANDNQFGVSLWGKNLTDDSSIVYGFDGCAFGGGFCAFRNAPRTYGVELRVAF